MLTVILMGLVLLASGTPSRFVVVGPSTHYTVQHTSTVLTASSRSLAVNGQSPSKKSNATASSLEAGLLRVLTRNQ